MCPRRRHELLVGDCAGAHRVVLLAAQSDRGGCADRATLLRWRLLTATLVAIVPDRDELRRSDVAAHLLVFRVLSAPAANALRLDELPLVVVLRHVMRVMALDDLLAVAWIASVQAACVPLTRHRIDHIQSHLVNLHWMVAGRAC